MASTSPRMLNLFRKCSECCAAFLPQAPMAQAGTTEVFADALPGLPDGISRASSPPGAFWCAHQSVPHYSEPCATVV